MIAPDYRESRKLPLRKASRKCELMPASLVDAALYYPFPLAAQGLMPVEAGAARPSPSYHRFSLRDSTVLKKRIKLLIYYVSISHITLSCQHMFVLCTLVWMKITSQFA